MNQNQNFTWNETTVPLFCTTSMLAKWARIFDKMNQVELRKNIVQTKNETSIGTMFEWHSLVNMLLTPT